MKTKNIQPFVMKTFSKRKYLGSVSGIMFNLNKAQVQNFITST